MDENNKLVNIILGFYALVKLNILSVLTLIIGLFFFTFQPTIKASIYVVKMMKEKKIDGYTTIRDYYMPVFKKELKNFKRNLPCNLILIWLLCIFIITRRYSSQVMAVIGIVILYLIFMIVLFNMYWQLLNVKLEEDDRDDAQLIEGIVYMFSDIKKFLISMVLLFVFSFLTYRCAILIVFVTVSFYIYIFYTINNNSYKFMKLLDMRRKNKSQ